MNIEEKLKQIQEEIKVFERPCAANSIWMLSFIESQQKTIEDMKQRELYLESTLEGWSKLSKTQISMIEELIEEKDKLKQ